MRATAAAIMTGQRTSAWIARTARGVGTSQRRRGAQGRATGGPWSTAPLSESGLHVCMGCARAPCSPQFTWAGCPASQRPFLLPTCSRLRAWQGCGRGGGRGPAGRVPPRLCGPPGCADSGGVRGKGSSNQGMNAGVELRKLHLFAHCLHRNVCTKLVDFLASSTSCEASVGSTQGGGAADGGCARTAHSTSAARRLRRTVSLDQGRRCWGTSLSATACWGRQESAGANELARLALHGGTSA